MREIKFRGQRCGNGEWIEGYLVKQKTNIPNKYICYICPVLISYVRDGFISRFEKVDPETIGQFTGLSDKNGKDIYEGDVLKIENWSTLFKVIFDEYYAKFTVEKINHDAGRKMDYIPDCEVIGNIHENPELLR